MLSYKKNCNDKMNYSATSLATNLPTLAERVRWARERAGLSQSALARAVGATPQAIQLLEAGQVRRPRNLVEIAGVLKVSPNWVLTGEEVSAWAIAEPGPTDGPTDHREAPLPAEAVEFARLWLQLSPVQRAVLEDIMRALTRQNRN